MYCQFDTEEECDEYLGRQVTIESVKARLIEIKSLDVGLFFTFEYEDGTTEILDSETALCSVIIDNHSFGKKVRYKDFTPEQKSEYNKRHKKMDYEKHREKRINYQASYYQKNKKDILKKRNIEYRKKCGLL